MNGWAAIFGSIFTCSDKSDAFEHTVSRTAHFKSVCGKYHVCFKEQNKDYLDLIKNRDNTITHRGITFSYVYTSIN